MKHFINLSDYSKNELRKILTFAKKIKNNENKYNNIFKKKYLGLIFQKQSIRTRLSFTIGIKKLGGSAIELNEKQIGFGKRETYKDILKVMSLYLDVIMIRNNDHKLLSKLAELDIIPIINGLSDFSHPCQILSDIFTIEECLGKIESKTITWIGDYNNVLNSLIEAAEIFEFKLNILLPKTLAKKQIKSLDKKNLKFSYFIDNFDIALQNSDCIMTDSWFSMGEKKSLIKKNRLKKYQVNDKILKKAKKSAIFMHCLPAHRNEEVTNSVIDGKQSKVWLQALNRMFIQQSILYYLLQNDKN